MLRTADGYQEGHVTCRNHASASFKVTQGQGMKQDTNIKPLKQWTCIYNVTFGQLLVPVDYV